MPIKKQVVALYLLEVPGGIDQKFQCRPRPTSSPNFGVLTLSCTRVVKLPVIGPEVILEVVLIS
jgi:hypothetical protein